MSTPLVGLAAALFTLALVCASVESALLSTVRLGLRSTWTMGSEVDRAGVTNGGRRFSALAAWWRVASASAASARASARAAEV